MSKTLRGKDKVKAKIEAKKKKIAAKLGKGAALVAILALCGCAASDPASRYTAAKYEITIKVGEKAHDNSINLPFGDGALQSADSSGSTETQTSTPSLDIKPDVNVNYAQGGGISNRGTGGAEASGAAGVLERLLGSLTDEGLAALKSALANKTTGTVTLKKKDGTTVTADCKDGSCTFPDGTTVTAADCGSCAPGGECAGGACTP